MDVGAESDLVSSMPSRHRVNRMDLGNGVVVQLGKFLLVRDFAMGGVVCT